MKMGGKIFMFVKRIKLIEGSCVLFVRINVFKHQSLLLILLSHAKMTDKSRTDREKNLTKVPP